MAKIKLRSFLFFIATAAIAVANVAIAEVKWSVSPLLGVNSPDLGLLNDKVLGSSLGLSGELLFSDGEGPRQVKYNIDNPLPKIRYGTEAGIEFQMELNPRNSFVIGMTSWEGVSTSLVKTTLPFQGKLKDTVYERRASISYLQYYLGWRRDLFKRHKKYTIYSRLMLSEVFDIDFRENFVFEFTDPANGGTTFKRIRRLETQATGLLMLQPAIGGELFMREWLSIGFDFGYSYSLNKFELGNAIDNSDFQGQDSVSLTYPTGPSPENSRKLGYLSDVGERTYEKMELDMNGWRALFKINVYY
ncbi:MAG TPA: hypothetical protein ENJ28_07080 [Gammaproteobacteria bacterium]|nr:hypothetical protein [Gammaproteobacteria bacterium]